MQTPATDAVVGAPRRLAVRIRLAEIVEARPDELAVDLRIPVLMEELDVGVVVVRTLGKDVVA